MSTPLSAVCRLPAPDDNVAIAIRRLDAGTRIEIDGEVRTLASCVLEGHRLAVRPIAPGEALLSWGLPFGHALVPIAPGDYVCNESMLQALAVRQLGVPLPSAPNFADYLVPFALDPATYRPGQPVDRVARRARSAATVAAGGRGVGTRNTIVILGHDVAHGQRRAPARVAAAAAGARRTRRSTASSPSPTPRAAGRASRTTPPRCCARWPGSWSTRTSARSSRSTTASSRSPTRGSRRSCASTACRSTTCAHAFLSVGGGLAAGLAAGEKIVRGWIDAVEADARTEEPLGGLRIALQCGGSDAFSGVSGNPLAGAIVHELIRHGGTGVLCETDETAGAEAYVLRNTRGHRDCARRCSGHIQRFKERLSWHGVTPESNPSGGNKLRGLYNITLKSLGAVHKKDPRTPVDHVIDYADPLEPRRLLLHEQPGQRPRGHRRPGGARAATSSCSSPATDRSPTSRSCRR